MTSLEFLETTKASLNLTMIRKNAQWDLFLIYLNLVSALYPFFKPRCILFPRWLKEQKKLNICVEPRVKNELLAESSYYGFVQTWLDGNTE